MTLSETGPAPLETVRSIVPLIRQNADATEEHRELPRPLFEALADAGLFRMLIPRSLGGWELDLPTYIRVIEEIGQADASTGWCINQGGVFATFSARLPRDLARLIWVETPRSVVANTPQPDATSVAVEGGFRVTGRLSFSTGSRHASWFAAFGKVVDEAGQPRRLPDGSPETRYHFVPAAEVEINDTWQVRGLRGTGTHHFTVQDVFVPVDRTFLAANPGPLLEPGPLYVYPRTLLFASGDAAVALGVARAALDALVDLAGAKRPRAVKGLLRDQPIVQSQMGHAEAHLRSGRALLRETVREVWEEVCATGAITIDQRVAMRVAVTHAMRLSVQVVDLAYDAAGATAAYQSSPIQRCFQDIHVITQHIQARMANYEMVGRYYLGLDPDLGRL